MHSKVRIVLVAAALLLVGTSCGGSVCVGYGCYTWDPCYPWCPYGYLVGWDTSTPLAAQDAVVGDFDGDGEAELLVLDDAGGLTRFVGDLESGKYEDTTPLPLLDGPESRRILAAHCDDDGMLDLIAIDDATGWITVLLGTGDGAFVAAPPARAAVPAGALVDVEAEDVDGDGLGDLVVLHSVGQLSVLVSDGNGGFVSASRRELALPEAATPTARIVCAELDGLPGADVAVVLPEDQRVLLLGGLGDGTFGAPQRLDAQLPEPLLDATWVDGRDGHPADLILLFASEVDEDHRVVRLQLHGEDAGLLENDTTGVRFATRVDAADVTGDGLADLILVDPEAGTVELLRAVP